MVLSLSVILVLWFEIDVSEFNFFGIEPRNKMDESVVAILLFLSVSHIVNWTSDVISNGSFSLFVKKKPLEGMADIQKERSYIRDIKDSLERIEKSQEKPQSDMNEAQLLERAENIRESLKFVIERMDDLEQSGWWFSAYARFYVIGWNFLVPIAISLLAIDFLYHA